MRAAMIFRIGDRGIIVHPSSMLFLDDSDRRVDRRRLSLRHQNAHERAIRGSLHLLDGLGRLDLYDDLALFYSVPDRLEPPLCGALFDAHAGLGEIDFDCHAFLRLCRSYSIGRQSSDLTVATILS